jgi:DNA-binding NtrC family response regulator
VRELKNFVQATVAMGEPAELGDDHEASATLEHLRRGLQPFAGRPYGEARTDLLREFERYYLEQLMAASHGNVAQAARDAEMARSHLNELLRKHKIR